MIPDLRLCELCWEAYNEPLSFDQAGTHIRITKEDGYTVVAFRGSMSVLDWVRNLIFSPFDASTHAGFMASAVRAWGPIPSEGEIILTGHSAGGAIAQLVASMFVSGGKVPASLVTFGTPRICPLIFDSISDLLANVPGTDYRNGDDPVPQLPVGLRHPRSVTQLGTSSFGIISVEDHMIGPYYEAVKLLSGN